MVDRINQLCFPPAASGSNQRPRRRPWAFGRLAQAPTSASIPINVTLVRTQNRTTKTIPVIEKQTLLPWISPEAPSVADLLPVQLLDKNRVYTRTRTFCWIVSTYLPTSLPDTRIPKFFMAWIALTGQSVYSTIIKTEPYTKLQGDKLSQLLLGNSLLLNYLILNFLATSPHSLTALYCCCAEGSGEYPDLDRKRNFT